MNIPNKVRIGSMDYEITFTNEPIVLNRQECKGMIDYDFHEIKISNSVQDKQGQEQTFLHEIVHGIIREGNLDLQNSDEETITDEIAVGLHQIIRDNPDIFGVASKEPVNVVVSCDGKVLAENMLDTVENRRKILANGRI